MPGCVLKKLCFRSNAAETTREKQQVGEFCEWEYRDQSFIHRWQVWRHMHLSILWLIAPNTKQPQDERLKSGGRIPNSITQNISALWSNCNCSIWPHLNGCFLWFLNVGERCKTQVFGSLLTRLMCCGFPLGSSFVFQVVTVSAISRHTIQETHIAITAQRLVATTTQRSLAWIWAQSAERRGRKAILKTCCLLGCNCGRSCCSDQKQEKLLDS